MSAIFKGLVFGLALFFVCSGWASNAAAYPDHAESTLTDVTVHVAWLPDYATVDAACAALDGEIADGTILACYYPPDHLIIAVEPTSFNDHFNLSIIGHEFWHALGAKHPEIRSGH